MGARDYQLMVSKETTYGTIVTPSRGFEYNGDNPLPIQGQAGRTMGEPLRGGSRARRKDRVTPYFNHAEGTISMDVLDKGFGFWLEHMLGTVATTGSGPYVHTGTEGGTSSLMGKSFTAQFNAPFNPTGTNQAITFSGGKVKQWTLSNSVDEDLVLDLDCDFAAQSTATALATASYPSTMTNLTWAGGVITVGGSSVDVTEVSIEGNNNLNVDRRQIRGNTMEKEPTPGQLEVSASFTADFADLTQWNRVYSLTQAGTQAAFTGTWTAGTSSLVVTIPALELDEFSADDDTGLMQELSGVGLFDGTNSVVSIAYTTADTTP
jgi:hypothetical protein